MAIFDRAIVRLLPAVPRPVLQKLSERYIAGPELKDARETVRRAYQNVLKREPDAASSGYVDKVLRQHWTQADVEKELRKSPEFRNRGGR